MTKEFHKKKKKTLSSRKKGYMLERGKKINNGQKIQHKGKGGSHQESAACPKTTGNGSDEKQHVMSEICIKINTVITKENNFTRKSTSDKGSRKIDSRSSKDM